MRSATGLIEVSVGGGTPAWFCVDPDSDDPVSDHLLEHGSFDELGDRVALDLVRPGMRVLDVGRVCGTFALPAAALGAEVAALDASAPQLGLLEQAAVRNDFTALRTVAADEPADGSGSRWPGLGPVLAHLGWDAADVIRCRDAGAALALLAGPDRADALVLDADAMELARLGSSVDRLLALSAERGYHLFLVDTIEPGALVETAPGDIQPGARETYVALDAGLEDVPPGWRAEPGLDRDELARRILEGAASDVTARRSYAAALLASGPDWLRRDPAVPAALAALETDIAPTVRAAATSISPPTQPASGLPPPARGAGRGAPAQLALLAREVSVRSPGSGFERPAGASLPGELTLQGFSAHLRAGDVLGVLVEDDETAPELLAALAGLTRVADGRLSTREQPILISRLDRLVEPALTVAENIVLLGAFFGGHPAEVEARAPEIAGRAALGRSLERRLSEISGVDLTRLGLATALEVATVRLLLVDSTRPIGDAGFRRWAGNRLAELLPAGASLVQAVRDPSHLLRAPDRLLWAGGGRVVAQGHPESVAFAFRHRLRRPDGDRRGQAPAERTVA